MNRISIYLVTLTFIVAMIALGPLESKVGGDSGDKIPGRGCIACHPKLSETIAKAKSAEGGASNFSAKVHRSHYAQLGAAAQCQLCHQIDARGNLRLIGMETDQEIKTTAETLVKMQPYYRSWAASAFLDQRHGRRGITCRKCHGAAMPESTVNKEQCFTCHGSYEKLAERSNFHTGTLYPHFTPEPMECNLCHKGHEKSAVFCTQCHQVEAKMP